MSTGLSIGCTRLRFAYELGKDRVVAVDDVSLDVRAGTATALLGPAGSGKSTLLLLLRGLLQPDGGLVTLDGARPEDEGYEDLRRSVGLVFQHAERQLFASTVRDDVAFGPRQLGWQASRVAASVDEALALVGLPGEVFGGRHPYSLSGGEQRRLALAGVLAMRPRALLLDEPFVGLDPAARRDLAGTLRGLHEAGRTLVLATHEVDRAWELCDERVILAQGRVVAAGGWAFGGDDEALLAAYSLQTPTLVDLWGRLGLPAKRAPRTAAEAAEALA